MVLTEKLNKTGAANEQEEKTTLETVVASSKLQNEIMNNNQELIGLNNEAAKVLIEKIKSSWKGKGVNNVNELPINPNDFDSALKKLPHTPWAEDFKLTYYRVLDAVKELNKGLLKLFNSKEFEKEYINTLLPLCLEYHENPANLTKMNSFADKWAYKLKNIKEKEEFSRLVETFIDKLWS